MNNNIFNTETIEAYLENKLSHSEKIRFESELKKDPLVESEVTLQKDIIESLKQHRKAQLKNRLNNIEVSMSPSYFEIGAKIAASVIISGLVSFGVYTYFKGDSKDSVATLKTESNSVITNTEVNSNSTPSNTIISEPIISPVTQESQKELVQTTNTKEKNTVKNTAKASEKRSIENFSKRTNPSIEENFDNNSDFKSEENVTVPKGQIAQATDNKSSVNVTIDGTTNNKFHYKYFSNKLFLYGNFNTTTYEILELNTYNNKQVYLYYDNKYYKLNANQVEIAPLVQITESKTISDLKKLNK